MPQCPYPRKVSGWVLHEGKAVAVKMIQRGPTYWKLTAPKALKEKGYIGPPHKTEAACIRYGLKRVRAEAAHQRARVEGEKQCLVILEAREEALKTRLKLISKKRRKG